MVRHGRRRPERPAAPWSPAWISSSVAVCSKRPGRPSTVTDSTTSSVGVEGDLVERAVESVVMATVALMSARRGVVVEAHVVGLHVEVGRAEVREQLVADCSWTAGPGSTGRRRWRRGRRRRRGATAGCGSVVDGGAWPDRRGAAVVGTPSTVDGGCRIAARPRADSVRRRRARHAAEQQQRRPPARRRVGAASAVEVGVGDRGPVADRVHRLPRQHAAAGEQSAALPVGQAELGRVEGVLAVDPAGEAVADERGIDGGVEAVVLGRRRR